MDWYLPPDDTDAPRELRRELGEYLSRHARPGSDIEGAVLAVWEMVSNAIHHAGGSIWVSLDWSAVQPVCEVNDLGPGFELPELEGDEYDAGPGRGLRIVSHLSRELRVAHKRAGGARVAVELPIERPLEASFPVVRRRLNRLPDLDEARPDGTFDREAFLRALVVQLAEAVEMKEGPASLEAAVTEVGWSVGGQMEEAYRRALGILDPLSSEQMADLYVRLKHAIDGGFYVIEVDEEKIVLGNSRCPFGDDVVKRSPGLCRMTSSVFGGIAARNRGGSSVVLEERIALGDPGCRVVVRLGEAAERDQGHAHRYRASEEEDPTGS